MNLKPILLGLTLLVAPALHAQFGDDPKEGPQRPQTEVARHPTPSPALTAEQEQLTFKLAPGFKIELMAADPLVHDPVAAAYDREGNLWVVEFSNFNSGMIRDVPALAAGVKESDIPKCMIVKLESSHHDGRLDRRTVWLDGMTEARGIMIVRAGILISDPPNLWLVRDPHGTGRGESKTLLLDNYEAMGNPEESGSLLWGRDNVIHDIDFSYDYRYRDGAMERVAVPVRGQFGIGQDDYGRLYFCRSTDHLRCDLFGVAYSLRNGNVLEVPWADNQIGKDQEVWPSHPNMTNRGYRIGRLGWHIDGVRADGTLLEFTAACSPLIYRGANFPGEFYGNAFIPEPAANLIKRNLLPEANGQMSAVNAYTGKEFLTSTDSRFRPVALLNAPDGSIVVVDMYRGVLQEYHYLTSYLRDQSLARGLDKPFFGLGRLWRITYEGGALEHRQPDLDQMSSKELAGLLSHPDAWWRDTAQQEIVERGDWSAVPALEDLARNAPGPTTRVCALWTLDGLKAARPELLKEALSDPSPKVRAAAVRLHERFLRGADADATVRQLSAVMQDAEPEVLVQLALTLGEAHTAASLDAMYQLLAAARDVPYLPSAVATGIGGREFVFLQRLQGQLGALGPRPEIASMLAILSTAIVHQGDTDQVQSLIAGIGDGGGLPKWARTALLSGFEPVLTPNFRRSVGPARLIKSESLAPLVASSDPEIRTGSEKFSQALAKAEEALREAHPAVALTAEEKISYDRGMLSYQVCAGCHQPTGTGTRQVAPSLVDSHWVSSYPEVAIRIVLCGKEGTPGFPGPMPPIGGTFSDEQIAGVLTYVRNSWGLHQGAVDVATVARVRNAVGNRQTPWTDAELRRVEGTVASEKARAAAHPP
jgi:mono/diheme cytochrome c family protein/glucose/arabinose dehydrogenase